jgi:hypothetical protein
MYPRRTRSHISTALGKGLLIAVIDAVGVWINGQWHALQTAL